jgi:hypothetical protein
MPENRTLIRTILLLTSIVLIFIPVASSADSDSLTRGNTFTVTVVGKPNTTYYVWLTRTSTMSGEPGDQPPVIASYQANVEQDPAGGPYVIGSYRFNNGGGRMILDDVAPSSSTTSNTNYYAQVTTDVDGMGIVAFRTSSSTAERKFSVRAENPQVPGDTVYVQLGVPTPVSTQTTMIPIPTIATPSPVPAATQTTAPTTAPVTILVTQTLVSMQTPVQAQTPEQKMPLDSLLSIVAAGTGLFTLRKKPL